MPAAEFVKEAWKLALYAIFVFIFILNLLYSWNNYHDALGYAEDLREARMNAVALLNKWGEDGAIDTSKVSSDDLPDDTVVGLYTEDGTLIMTVSS
jgi:hypothetical protein